MIDKQGLGAWKTLDLWLLMRYRANEYLSTGCGMQPAKGFSPRSPVLSASQRALIMAEL